MGIKKGQGELEVGKGNKGKNGGRGALEKERKEGKREKVTLK